jgi:EAL domain-containing protein (putative c-di-GMP-specific phosphodiesterase class I)
MIKIDRSLVALIDTEPRAESVVTGITDLARRLGAICIAEGVEELGQLVRLRRMGCQLAQGYLFSPGLPATQLEALVRDSAWRAEAAPLVRPAWGTAT